MFVCKLHIHFTFPVIQAKQAPVASSSRLLNEDEASGQLAYSIPIQLDDTCCYSSGD
jgi:hypothetical protein